MKPSPRDHQQSVLVVQWPWTLKVYFWTPMAINFSINVASLEVPFSYAGPGYRVWISMRSVLQSETQSPVLIAF